MSCVSISGVKSMRAGVRRALSGLSVPVAQ